MVNRAIVFVDGNNLHEGLWACFRIRRLDLQKFSTHIVQWRTLERIYYADANYIQYPQTNRYKEQQDYFAHLRGMPNVVFRPGYYRIRRGIPQEKLVDVHLAVDLVDLCHQNAFDTAYVISGDADLKPAIKVVRNLRKRVINVYLEEQYVRSGVVIERKPMLKPNCDAFLRITKTVAQTFQWVPLPSQGVATS